MRPIVAALLLTACGAPASPPATAPAPITTAPIAATPAPPSAPSSPSDPAAPGGPATGGRLPVGSGAVGTAGPTILRAADADERWVALCQARSDTDGNGKIEIRSGNHGAIRGDRMDLYLVLGGGSGTRIDALAGQSADGRWLAIVRGGKVELVDAQTGEVFELRGADAQSDDRPYAPHRAAMFAKNKLLYIRRTGGDDRLVVHDPADHGEREIPVPDRLWRIDRAPDRIARIYTVPRGQPFPVLETNLAIGECVREPTEYDSKGDRGPKPTERWIDLDTGKEIAADGGKVAVGATIVRIPSDGALYFDGDQIAPPACRAQLLAVMSQPVRAIAICGERKQAKILLLGKGLRKQLASIDRGFQRYGDLEGTSATGVVCGGNLHCVATATNRYIDLKGGVAEHAWGTRLYVVNAKTPSRKHEIIDVTTGARTPIGSHDARMVQGKYIVDEKDNVIDLDAGAILGKIPPHIRLVSAKGRALVPAAPDDSGPLRWIAPS